MKGYTSLRFFTYSIVSFTVTVYILRVGSFILIPIVWATFFTFALFPLSKWFEYKRIPRLISILLSMLLVTTIALTIAFLFITQVTTLLKDAPDLGIKVDGLLTELERTLQERFGFQHEINREITSYLNESSITSALQFTTATITTLTLMPVFIFLFLYYQDFFHEFINRLALHGNVSFFEWLKEAVVVVRKYLTGMLLVTLIVSVVATIMFYFLGVKYYLLFGLFTAICNLAPYIGVIIGSFITLLYILITTDSLWYPVIALFMLWLLQVIENNLITPVIVGARIKLNPLAVILAIITGGALWGISGMILFIPLLGIIKIFLDKTASLKPYSYLLGDDIPIQEAKENIFRYLKRKFTKRRQLHV